MILMSEHTPTSKAVRDRLHRPLRDLRISVTDRCNFRCVYCMPREIFGPGYAFLPRKDLLTLEEIARVAQVFAALGMRKVRITGGEPLIRRNLEHLIEMIDATEGVQDISLTTNGSMLTADRAVSLKQAGLKRLTISLDALDDATFKSINDVDYPASRVLDGIDNARAVGFSDIKVNAVVRRGLNEHAVLDLAKHFRYSGCIVRFIEYMDVGETNGWNLDDVEIWARPISCEGDTNQDQVVDIEDFSELLIQFGQVGIGLSADFNGDFNVDADDFSLLLINFGNDCNTDSKSSSAVLQKPKGSALNIAKFIVD